MRLVPLVLLLVSLASCKGREKDYTGDACPKRLATSTKRMGEMKKRLRIRAVGSIAIPDVANGTGKALARPDLVISIAPNEVKLNGTIASKLGVDLKRRIDLAKSFSPENKSATRLAYVVAAATLPAKRLQEVVIEARKHQWDVALVVKAPDYDPIERQAPGWMKALSESFRKDGFTSPAQAKKFDEAVARAAGSCESLVTLFDSVKAKSVDPEQRQDIVATTIPEAVKECGCDFDVDAIEALALERFMPTNVHHRILELPPELPDKGTVAELSAAIAAR